MRKAKISFKALPEQEMLFFGEFFEDNQKRVLSFVEEAPSGAKTRSVLEESDGVITLKRKGEISMDMRFVEGEKHVFDVVTEFGSIPAELFTIASSSTKSDDAFTVELHYDLLLQGEAENHHILISAKLI